jgi:hypothetical protein
MLSANARTEKTNSFILAMEKTINKVTSVRIIHLLVIGVGFLFVGCSTFRHENQNPADNFIILSTTHEDRTTQLQSSFAKFPLLKYSANSLREPAFQTLNFTNPLIISGTNYYGFRLQVPRRKNHEDFVWAFVEPQVRFNWYILPKTDGDMMGFTHYNIVPKDYLMSDHLFPLNGINLYLQSLSGELIQDSKTYLIWFSFQKNAPKHLSLIFAFAAHVADSTNEVKAIEDVLALKHPLRDSTSANATSDADVMIISARYGSGTHYTNVIDRVGELLRQPDGVFFAQPKWLEADPTPGWNKELIIVYKFKGQSYYFTTGEGGKVSLKILLQKGQQ